jgi:hypothetical protein
MRCRGTEDIHLLWLGKMTNSRVAESREQRAESREQRAESREQRAESREQRAESREHRGERREEIARYNMTDYLLGLREERRQELRSGVKKGGGGGERIDVVIFSCQMAFSIYRLQWCSRTVEICFAEATRGKTDAAEQKADTREQLPGKIMGSR